MLLRYQNSRNQLVDICQICIDSLVVLVMEIIRIVYPKSVHYSLMGFGATVLLLSHYTTKDVLNLWLSFPNICLNFY